MHTLAELVDLGRRHDERRRELVAGFLPTADRRLAAQRQADKELRAYLADARCLPVTEMRELCLVLAQMALVEADACRDVDAEQSFIDAAESLTDAVDRIDEARGHEAGHRPTRNRQLHLYGCCEGEAA